jgi:hypothetical protein
MSIPDPIGYKSLSTETARKLLGVYQLYDFMKIPGYRPWTNWKFINSLTDIQRDQLASELRGYIAEYGFTE